MIVKYKIDNIWCYADNVSLTATKNIDTETLIEKFDNDVHEGKRIDVCSYEPNSTTLLPMNTIASNKVFIMATEDKEEWPEYDDGDKCHCVNLIDGTRVIENFPASIVLIYHDYFNNSENFKITTLVTNQTVYLMNDKGQTIERLV